MHSAVTSQSCPTNPGMVKIGRLDSYVPRFFFQDLLRTSWALLLRLARRLRSFGATAEEVSRGKEMMYKGGCLSPRAVLEPADAQSQDVRLGHDAGYCGEGAAC